MSIPVPLLLLRVPITSLFLTSLAHHSRALSSTPRPLKAVAARFVSGASPLFCGSDKDLLLVSRRQVSRAWGGYQAGGRPVRRSLAPLSGLWELSSAFWAPHWGRTVGGRGMRIVGWWVSPLPLGLLTWSQEPCLFAWFSFLAPHVLFLNLYVTLWLV